MAEESKPKPPHVDPEKPAGNAQFDPRQQTVRADGFQRHGCCAVTEDRAGFRFGEIECRGGDVRPHDQRAAPYAEC